MKPTTSNPSGCFVCSTSGASAVASIHAVRLAMAAVGAGIGATLQRFIGWISLHQAKDHCPRAHRTMGGCHGHQSLLRRHRKFLFEARDGFATSTEVSASGARRRTGPARILISRKRFLLRAWIWEKAFALGLFAGELPDPSDCLIVLPGRPFRWLFVEPSELHLPEHPLSLHFLFEDTKRLVNVVVANQDLQVMIPSLR